MSSERQAFMEAILRDPEDDTVRLVFADYLEENGEPERAEFIRSQCWLWANPSCGGCTGEEWVHGKPCAECDRRNTLRGKTGIILFAFRMWHEWSGAARELIPVAARWDDHIHFARGFVHSVTCTAADWLKHADALHWHPGQMAKCPNGDCAGGMAHIRDQSGRRIGGINTWNGPTRGGWPIRECQTCDGTGHIPLPCPPTAQPIREVTLTTQPYLTMDWVTTLREGNVWHIAKWPGINFRLPHA
jgi:uncharacterized protein (TIGR02996 family)